jgi:hypothetical protein
MKPKRTSKIQATAEIERYSQLHPGSPSAVRRPSLSLRGQMWVALLGPRINDGIVGLGPTVEAALRAFDAQYLNALRSPLGR